MKTIALAVAAILAALVLYLAFWPVPIDPVAWTPPAAPALAGPYAPNRRLAAVEWIGRGVALGPESTAIDREGRVHTGTRDGRILRLAADGRFEEVARTGGRPLGMAFDAAGDLLVCDLRRGLLSVTPAGAVTVLATGEGGLPFRFIDDVDVGPDGTVYFTDASSRFDTYRPALLDFHGDGRLLAYYPATRQVERLLGDLVFANGVAVSGDGSFLLVNETGKFRIHRYWLQGPRRGSSEIFAENLPGFPDNVTWSRERGVFWVALFSPRLPAFDDLLPHPWLRTIVFRLPEALQPKPARRAFALALDASGRVVEDLQDDSPSAFAPVTSVRERAGTLWLGSLEREALGRVAAPPP